jgi:hypothetical protein
MANLKPIGSEKLQGQDKINRIMEIARFNETLPQPINETSKSEFSVSLADGNNYQIVRERQGYIIKKTISESETDYIEPMKNRKYYSSYSQALKRLNLVAGELNRINENEEGVSLYGEQKKFTLKTPKPAVEAPAPAAELPAAPPAVPSPELPASPMGDEMGMGDELAPEVDDVDVDVDIDATEKEDDDEQVTFKTIQKLTGKLTQKIRVLDNNEGMTSEDIKYVINMVLSSLNLKELSEEDKEDIVNKFDKDSVDLGGDDMGGEDLTDDSEVEDIQADMDLPVEGEVDEDFYFNAADDESDMSDSEKEGNFGKGSNWHVPTRKPKMIGSFDDEHGWFDDVDAQSHGDVFSDYDEEEFEDFPSLEKKYGGKHGWFGKGELGNKIFNMYKEKHGKPFKVRTAKKSDNGAILDSIFGESKVDKVISKYFETSKKEILESKEKKAQKNLQVKKVMETVVTMTETFEQEMAAKKFLQENSNSKFVGITNKKNLVFENKGGQVKISPEGNIL